jgi:hypothetical protein
MQASLYQNKWHHTQEHSNLEITVEPLITDTLINGHLQ